MSISNNNSKIPNSLSLLRMSYCFDHKGRKAFSQSTQKKMHTDNTD